MYPPPNIKSHKSSSTINHFLDVTPREDNSTPHQYSCLENPMDGGAW